MLAVMMERVCLAMLCRRVFNKRIKNGLSQKGESHVGGYR